MVLEQLFSKIEGRASYDHAGRLYAIIVPLHCGDIVIKEVYGKFTVAICFRSVRLRLEQVLCVVDGDNVIKLIEAIQSEKSYANTKVPESHKY